MKQITLSSENYNFLKELQQELNTQTNDGNADPVYWGVMETKEVGVPDGCGDPRIYLGDGQVVTLKEAIDYIGDYIDEDNNERWNEVQKSDMDAVVSFCNFVLGWSFVRIVFVEKKSEISRMTGAFLTKRACKEYIDKYGYNHTKPHTYAMTAFRNYELEKLLKILKTLNFEEY